MPCYRLLHWPCFSVPQAERTSPPISPTSFASLLGQCPFLLSQYLYPRKLASTPFSVVRSPYLLLPRCFRQTQSRGYNARCVCCSARSPPARPAANKHPRCIHPPSSRR